ncbi:alpha/beta hydrolase family protein [Yoonia maritima]|uniref:Alpha/beta hydrolase family protein n=1 Tax=Yoonia maritima TaxID=1435347 RepID=A0A2T0W0M8_9RHOB|nr:alpha/beta hydrolase [Yoonia maritima]PRY78330.1 alpha/beta hydrolase family protein [Yoonia maritima]
MSPYPPTIETPYFTRYDDVPFGTARHNGDTVTLHCSIFSPKAPKTPPPLFVWFHQGSFKFGDHNHKLFRKLGRRLTMAGIAIASVQYRLSGAAGDLSQTVLDNIGRIKSTQATLLRPGLCQERSLAALEDGVRFLQWAGDNQTTFGWGDKRVVGGASAGGITAFNIAYLARHLGLPEHDIQGVFSATGSFNYPDFVDPGRNLLSLAVHNPTETRVPIDGVQMMAGKLGNRFELLRSDRHIHGHCELAPGERPAKTFGRISSFIKRATE